MLRVIWGETCALLVRNEDGPTTAAMCRQVFRSGERNPTRKPTAVYAAWREVCPPRPWGLTEYSTAMGAWVDREVPSSTMGAHQGAFPTVLEGFNEDMRGGPPWWRGSVNRAELLRILKTYKSPDPKGTISIGPNRVTGGIEGFMRREGPDLGPWDLGNSDPRDFKTDWIAVNAVLLAHCLKPFKNEWLQVSRGCFGEGPSPLGAPTLGYLRLSGRNHKKETEGSPISVFVIEWKL